MLPILRMISVIVAAIVGLAAASAASAAPARLAAGSALPGNPAGLMQTAQFSIGGGGGFEIGIGGYGGASRYDRRRRQRTQRPYRRQYVRPRSRVKPVRPRPCRRYDRRSRRCRGWRPPRPVIVIRPPVVDDYDDYDDPPPRRTVRPRKPDRERTRKPAAPKPKPRPRRLASPPPSVIPPPPAQAPLPDVLAGLDDRWPGEVVVQLAPGSPAATEADLARAHNLVVVSSETNQLVNRRIVRFRFEDRRFAQSVADALAADPRVARAQPNWLYQVSQSSTPHSGSGGDGGLQYASMKLGLKGAHALALGRGVKVAVIDSGVDAGHPALAGALAARFDAAPERGLEIGEHGTAIAGILKASGVLKGVAPSADLLAVRAFFAAAKGGPEQSSTVIIMRALDWAVANGARVVNMSFAGPPDAAVAEVLTAAHRRGAILIAAAGNGGAAAKPAYPAAYGDVIAVTATDGDDHLYDMANRGAYIDVAAPGVDIFVVAPARAYKYSSGTSLAAAHVSGIVALLLERDRALGAAAVTAALRAGAADLGQPGPDADYGAGRVDASKLLNAATVEIAKPAEPQR